MFITSPFLHNPWPSAFQQNLFLEKDHPHIHQETSWENKASVYNQSTRILLKPERTEKSKCVMYHRWKTFYPAILRESELVDNDSSWTRPMAHSSNHLETPSKISCIGSNENISHRLLLTMVSINGKVQITRAARALKLRHRILCDYS